jgi:hypothetical protein
LISIEPRYRRPVEATATSAGSPAPHRKIRGSVTDVAFSLAAGAGVGSGAAVG